MSKTYLKIPVSFKVCFQKSFKSFKSATTVKGLQCCKLSRLEVWKKILPLGQLTAHQAQAARFDTPNDDIILKV